MSGNLLCETTHARLKSLQANHWFALDHHRAYIYTVCNIMPSALSLELILTIYINTFELQLNNGYGNVAH